MAETPGEKSSRDQIATLELHADNGAHIDTVGALIAFLIVLFATMRAQGRNRKLIERLARLENQRN